MGSAVPIPFVLTLLYRAQCDGMQDGCNQHGDPDVIYRWRAEPRFCEIGMQVLKAVKRCLQRRLIRSQGKPPYTRSTFVMAKATKLYTENYHAKRLGQDYSSGLRIVIRDDAYHSPTCRSGDGRAVHAPTPCQMLLLHNVYDYFTLMAHRLWLM